jgi:hypothetical protein
MKGDDVFVAMAFFMSGGNRETELEVKEVERNWSKGVIGKEYNSAYSTRAKGRTHSSGLGRFVLTEEGVSYVQELVGEVPAFATTLLIFKQGSTHSFDKFLRYILKKASHSVDIADTYVSVVLFDTLLDKIPDVIPIRFVYGNNMGDFVACAARFAKQYKFEAKESKQFHDRFIIVDGKGYIIGPSLKDAADKKPATVVALNAGDSKKLIDLFTEIWKTAR